MSTTRIAIVGMAGRFPGAENVETLWKAVVEPGVEAAQHFQTESGTSGFGVIEGAGLFDPDFFEMSPAEARVVTPEHRLFLQAAWEALEDAGIDVTALSDIASVFGSASNHSISYLQRLIRSVTEEQLTGAFGVLIGNAMDSLATRVGYKLGLRGECVSVQTHCSSSLVAVHLACQSLLMGFSDVALAGGVSVRGSIPEDQDAELARSVAQEGFILSPDGRCCAFLEGAAGTINGDGVAVVVLKRLEDALEAGDRIHAVITGMGINNDGNRKVGFTAPSVEGVEDAILDALEFADVAPATVGFIECHGTGTSLGDAIELKALSRVFETPDRQHPLYLGSVKSNIGHLAAGAGVTGLIKAALAVREGVIPPLTHAKDQRPHSGVTSSRILEVPVEATRWPDTGSPRRAGVTSLGIGGTNVHITLEQAPPRARTERAARPSSIVVWTAKSAASALAMDQKLIDFVETDRVDLADLSHSLRRRAKFSHRRAVAASTCSELAAALRAGRALSVPEPLAQGGGVVFVFPGYGTERAGVARDLVQWRSFREALEEVVTAAAKWTDFDLWEFLVAPGEASPTLDTPGAGLAIVAFEIALARTLIAWGIVPDAVIGSSLGEYAAACVAGSLELAETLELVHGRGVLLERVRGGGMMMLEQTWSELVDAGLADGVEEAIQMSPRHTVVSGSRAVLERLEAAVTDRFPYKPLPVDIAFHSAAIDAIAQEFEGTIAGRSMRPPSMTYVSNVTGASMTANELADPRYWVRQMRGTVRFSDGVRFLYDQGARLFLEVGSGVGLAKLCADNFAPEEIAARSTVAHMRSEMSHAVALAEAVATAWLMGSEPDWEEIVGPGDLISAPTYAFAERHFYLGEALPTELEVPSHGRPIEEPTNEIERQVLEIWAETLGRPHIGIDDNFFDLGGDSLQAARAVAAIQDRLCPDLTIRAVLGDPTVRGVAQVVADLSTSATGAEADGYFCAYDLDYGGEIVTVYLTQEEYGEQGVPPEATNIRIL